MDKVYFARIEGQLPEDAVGRAAAGLVLEDGTKTLPARLEILEPGQVRLTIREGKFHQVKRMFEAMGCRVTYLKRLSMGPLVLDPRWLRGVPAAYRAGNPGSSGLSDGAKASITIERAVLPLKQTDRIKRMRTNGIKT